MKNNNNTNVKISEIIRELFSIRPFWSTQEIMAYLERLGFTKEQISGAIGYLRSIGAINIMGKLEYGHSFC